MNLLRSGVVEPVAGLWTSGPLHPDVESVAQGSFLKREPPAIRGRGYAPAALEAALWALARTSTFRDAVLAAVNLGEDADTTGAICGQLAGAIYGEDAIPLHWRERLAMRERIEHLADSLLELSRASGRTDE